MNLLLTYLLMFSINSVIFLYYVSFCNFLFSLEVFWDPIGFFTYSLVFCIVSVARIFLPGWVAGPPRNPPPLSWLGTGADSARRFYMQNLWRSSSIQQFNSFIVILMSPL